MSEDGIQKWKGLLAVFLSAVIITLLATVPSNTVSYQAEPVIQEDLLIETNYGLQRQKKEVEEVEAEDPMPIYDPETERVLHAIAVCESGDRQYNKDGSPIMNSQGSSATGRYQIMSSVWRKTAESMGYNIDTAIGNKKMAYYILTHAQGLQAWEASARCLYSRFNISI